MTSIIAAFDPKQTLSVAKPCPVRLSWLALPLTQPIRNRSAIVLMTDEGEIWWTVRQGAGPVVATAIHDGHELRPEVRDSMALPADERLREEDPFTGEAIRDVPTHVIVHRSRFEFDLNRAPTGPYIGHPNNAGDFHCGSRGRRSEDLVARSLAIHAEYYRDAWLAAGRHRGAPRAVRPDRRPQLQSSSGEARKRRPSRRKGARHQYRHFLDAAREMGLAARSADGADARVRLQRPVARRARKCRVPGQGRADPLRPPTLPGARLRDRLRIQEILHGRMERASQSRPKWRQCGVSSPLRPRLRRSCCNERPRRA